MSGHNIRHSGNRKIVIQLNELRDISTFQCNRVDGNYSADGLSPGESILFIQGVDGHELDPLTGFGGWTVLQLQLHGLHRYWGYKCPVTQQVSQGRVGTNRLAAVGLMHIGRGSQNVCCIEH
jgi:hypothetical protein